VKYINHLLPDSNTEVTPQQKFMLKQYLFDELSAAPSEDMVLQDFMSQHQNTSVDEYHDIDSLLATGDMAAAGNRNAQAAQSNDIVQTQNAYNALYINGINSKADLDNLSSLADLCPAQYGTAVYQARALLQAITYIGREYADSCGTQSLEGRFGFDDTNETSVSTMDGVQAKLYPNPNNGTFMLAYDLKNNADVSVLITDITGKVVYAATLDNLNHISQINISQLQNGIYFVQLSKNRLLLWTDKLMISK
jgi:hypothetical protein